VECVIKFQILVSSCSLCVS